MKPKTPKKPIKWIGSSLDDIKDERNFTENAKREAGHQLDQVQSGLNPDDWKPFETVGPGTKEIRIDLDDGWFRVMYVAKFDEAVYVLHCFKKQSNKASKKDVAKAKKRYKQVVKERRAK